jgi:two-component system, NarL family, response regulator DegU
MTEPRVIRILIADDFKVLRDVIRLHLKPAEDIYVIDEALDLFDALESAGALKPDVIIMNDYLPPIDSAHAAVLFREQGIPAAILVISMKAEADLVQRSFSSGVNGFMQKDEIEEFLVDAIRSVHRGERYLSPKAREVYGSIQE